MEKRELRKVAYDLMVQNHDGALATVSPEGVPHVVTVYCLTDKKLTLTFVTRTESRKFENIGQNNKVSMVFWDQATVECVQLTGTAARVEDLKKEQDFIYKLFTARFRGRDWPSPPMKLYESGASNELAVIQVKPFELTYANFEPKPDGRYQPFFYKII